MEVDLLPIFRSLLWDVLAKKAIVNSMAFLSLSPQGIIGGIVYKVLSVLAEKFYEQVALEIKIESIILTNAVKQKAWERSSIKLKLIAQSSGINSPEFKKAREEEHDKLIKAIAFNSDPTVVRLPNSKG